MLASKLSSVVAVAFALVPLGSGCSSSSDSCGTPTPEQCKDAAWLSSDPCGVKQRDAMRLDPKAFCNQVVVEASQAATEDIVPETVVDPETGGTAQAKVVPNASDGVSELLMPQTAVGLDQQTAVSATASGLSAADQVLRAQWEANGNRVESCREYVYEKYFDAARFEDAVAARHDDFPSVYDAAFGPSTATTSIGSRVTSGLTLKMRDGLDMPVQAIAARPHRPIADCTPSYGPAGSEFFLKNVFFAVPRAVFDAVRAQVDTNTAMAIDAGRCYERVDAAPPAPAAASWQWHRDRRAALLARGITLAELAARYADVKAFQEALVEYEKPEPACCIESVSMPCCWDYRTITRPSLEARLRELFLKAYADGCLGLDVNVCDWSPEYFVESLRATFGGAKETAYQRCVDLTKDDFVALAHKEFPMPWGPWQTAMDYTQSVQMVDQYFNDQALWRAAFYSALPADVKDPVDGSLRPPGAQKSAHHEAGNSLFAAYYDYLLAWDTPGLGLRTGSSTLPCVRDLGARGSFTAGGMVFGSPRQEVLDASFDAGLSTGVGGHLSVLGVQIWGQDAAPNQFTIVASSFDVSKKLVEKSRTFTVAYIPVTVAGGLAGTLHLEREVTVPLRVTSDGCYDGVTLSARFNPWVRLEAYASAAVGTAVASAGIECALTLLRLETPYTLAVQLALDGATGKLELIPTARGDFVVRTLDGRISLFVRVDLGLFDVGYSYDVFRWTGLRAQLPLFSSSYTLVLDDFVQFMSTTGT